MCLLLLLKTSIYQNPISMRKIGCNTTLSYGVHPYPAQVRLLENVMLHVYISTTNMVKPLSKV